MDDFSHGKRDKRGVWSPHAPARTAPLFVNPPRPLELLKWLPRYFLPYNVLFFASAMAWWAWIVPPIEIMQTFAWGWILKLLLANAVGAFLWYAGLEAHLYIRRAQGIRFKYNARFPADTPSNAFWFKNQSLDNFLRAFLSGIPIWTGVQVVVLWAFANGYAPWLSFAQNPLYLALLCLAVPIIHEFHFYCIHRLLHTPFLFRWFHSVHHRANNPSPWSSLSMHPVEHLLYFSTMFYHLIIPSHPMIALYQLHYAGFGAAPGHLGFDKIEVTDEFAIDSHAYIHHLHHKYFEVNYGDGLIPLDTWLGTFHDGSEEADARMKERCLKRLGAHSSKFRPRPGR